MHIQTKYLFIYLSVFYLFTANAIQPALGQQTNSAEIIELDQAQLDQMLAPIALYPDTLLSHILVASTYPLEVIQAARWRAANPDLDEQQALNAVENKDWDPSVQALVPFNDLLQKLSDDLDWLQSLGSAFLVNEQQILTSVQNLRQKAYEQGNLSDNDYINVEHDEDQIVIETIRREVVYVPYYDTRVVYGNWWWSNHQPYFWARPRHSLFSAGLYWSVGFNIRPSFYFGGFNWHNRHLVANYHYHKHANRYWSNHHSKRQVVRVKEYPRWNHNQQHRRGAQYRINGQRIVRTINGGNKVNTYKQIDKQRVLNVSDYAHKHTKNKGYKKKSKSFKQTLGKQQHVTHQTKSVKPSKVANNKQRVISQNKSQQKRVITNKAKTNNYKSNYKSNTKSNNYRAKSNKQNKSRPLKVSQHNKSKGKHR
ncbi:DUF3300 domain-containing protein [Paraglaciecola arctica]|uniref:DUF3300 domain-containing protein n=1 Tax=Paraglaciecola arctica TaxID=1128911 RepID=UPI001C06B3DF|nr:DUF3300 domain-containing protein [Paraglaciecola arctica]MBU3002194.1 DUF3300 domain-containing protein [Paraglaciecola arctica]